MSDATGVKRYASMGQGDCSVEEYPNGEYVLFTDYDSLAAQLRETQESLRVAQERLGVARTALLFIAGRWHPKQHHISELEFAATQALAAIGDVP